MNAPGSQGMERRNPFTATAGQDIRLLLDLSLWYQWNQERGSLPDRWKGMDLRGICADLRIPFWNVVRAYRTEYAPGAREEIILEDTAKIRRWETKLGSIEGRWTRGPDGDWWQTEYPVKSVEDIPIALEAARARTYAIADPGTPARTSDAKDSPTITALELPMHPYSEVLHSFLGWTEGFYIQSDAPDEIGELIAVLEDKRLDLAKRLAAHPMGQAASCFLSPDNLDGRFISPNTFSGELSPGYAALGSIAHGADKALVVHAGGTLAGLLPLLAEAGVDCVEGVAPTPQGDTALAEARSLSGPGMILWGGIPQDFLLPSSSEADFEAALERTLSEVQADHSLIAGVADRVPPDAIEERLLRLTTLR